MEQINSVPNDETSTRIPQKFILSCTITNLQDMVNEIYIEINSHLHDIDYFTQRVILSTKNDTTYDIYNYILVVVKDEGDILEQDILYPTEYLNTLKFRRLKTVNCD